MKTCPRCGDSYSERIDFCFNDGAVLQLQPSAMDAPVPQRIGIAGDSVGATPMRTFPDAEDPDPANAPPSPRSPRPRRTPMPAGPFTSSSPTLPLIDDVAPDHAPTPPPRRSPFSDDADDAPDVSELPTRPAHHADAPPPRAVSAAPPSAAPVVRHDAPEPQQHRDVAAAAPAKPPAVPAAGRTLAPATAPAAADAPVEDRRERGGAAWTLSAVVVGLGLAALLLGAVVYGGLRRSVSPVAEVPSEAVTQEEAARIDDEPAEQPERVEASAASAAGAAPEDAAPSASAAVSAPARAPSSGAALRGETPSPQASASPPAPASAPAPAPAEPVPAPTPTPAPRRAAPAPSPAASSSEEGGLWGDAPQAPTSGRATFLSDPPGAKVTIDGIPRGVTPMEVELSFGSHRVQLDLEGYQTLRREVDVRSTEPKFPATLTPSP